MQGLSGFGLGLQHLRNDGAAATTLSLSGLAAHTEVTLSFDLAMWDSIDLGDSFRIDGGGVPLFSSGPANPAFGNYFPPEPGPGVGPGVQITPAFNGFGSPNLGYNAGFRDSGRSVSFTFVHSGPALDVCWHYLSGQGGLDESFGLDNVSVTINAIPEPSTYALMELGLGVIVSVAARRRG
jgi:PEP-CTERM motif